MTDDSEHKTEFFPGNADHEACTKRQVTIVTIFNAILGLACNLTTTPNVSITLALDRTVYCIIMVNAYMEVKAAGRVSQNQ